MSKCPFLSNFNEKVSCFTECPLHEYEDTNGQCPFKTCKLERKRYKSVFNKYSVFEDDSLYILGEIYKKMIF